MDKNEKKLPDSKRFLVVYVFGLFSVALVLILLSFVSQARTDREMLSLSEKLSATESALLEKDQAVTGAQGRLDALQVRVNEQDELLRKQTEILQSMADALTIPFDNHSTVVEVQDAIAVYQEQQETLEINATAADLLSQMGYALVIQDMDAAQNAYDTFVQAYGEDGAGATLSTTQTEMFVAYQQHILVPTVEQVPLTPATVVP